MGGGVSVEGGQISFQTAAAKKSREEYERVHNKVHELKDKVMAAFSTSPVSAPSASALGDHPYIKQLNDLFGGNLLNGLLDPSLFSYSTEKKYWDKKGKRNGNFVRHVKNLESYMHGVTDKSDAEKKMKALYQENFGDGWDKAFPESIKKNLGALTKDQEAILVGKQAIQRLRYACILRLLPPIQTQILGLRFVNVKDGVSPFPGADADFAFYTILDKSFLEPKSINKFMLNSVKYYLLMNSDHYNGNSVNMGWTDIAYPELKKSVPEDSDQYKNDSYKYSLFISSSYITNGPNECVVSGDPERGLTFEICTSVVTCKRVMDHAKKNTSEIKEYNWKMEMERIQSRMRALNGAQQDAVTCLQMDSNNERKKKAVEDINRQIDEMRKKMHFLREAAKSSFKKNADKNLVALLDTPFYAVCHTDMIKDALNSLS